MREKGSIGIIVLVAVLILGIVAGIFLFTSKKEQPNNLELGPPDSRPRKSSEDICLTQKEHAKIPANAPKISIPFYMEDFSNAHWGFIPFCAYLKNVDETHNAFDFELKPNAPIIASADGVIEYTPQTDAVGAGEVLKINGDGFSLDYSGLKDIQVAEGQKVQKGDLLAYAFRTPYDEYHVHLGIFIDGDARYPIQYMDDQFQAALDEILPVSDFANYTDAPCACNCEVMISEE